MSEEDMIIDNTDDTDEELAFPEQKKIVTVQADQEVSSLHGKYKKGRLQLQPNYQRKYVWDAKKASRLIESVLLNIPIPMIYLAENDNKINVIDGQQRLTSLFSFIDGHFPDEKVFKLTGMQVFTDLKGKTFSDLDEQLQNKITDYTIRTITFPAGADPELQYEIFSRLNTGSVALNAQELRNCVYRGEFNDFIKELAADEDYLKLIGLSEPHQRMTDVELVLRFVSFFSYGYQNYKSPIKTFLNETMRKKANISENDKKQISKAFKNAVININSLLADKAFKRFYAGDEKNKNGHWEEKKFNVSLFDVLMDSMARLEPTVVMRHLDAIREAYIDLLSNDKEFIQSIEISTSSKEAIETRFIKWNSVLRNVIGTDEKEKRCFSSALKKELYEKDPTCAICGQKINSIDDCAVDHIEQYWLGGRTIPQNARLTHRYCNWSRPRKEN